MGSRRELVAGPGQVPRPPGPVSEVDPGDQRVGVLGARDQLIGKLPGCRPVRVTGT
jgi:hypothetical protein